MTTKTPAVNWAQMKEFVWITLPLADITEEKVSLEKDKLSFTGKSSGSLYSIELPFYSEITVESSEYAVTPRGLVFHLKKVEAVRWPHLLKEKNLLKSFVTVDWNKWVDSDDEATSGMKDFDMGNLDFQNFGAGMGEGLGHHDGCGPDCGHDAGEEEFDSDDEEGGGTAPIRDWCPTELPELVPDAK